MNIQIHTQAIEKTEAIENYVYKKLSFLEKVLPMQKEIISKVWIGKEVNSHKNGEIFKAEINVDFDGKVFRTESITPSLYNSIDEAVLEMTSVVKKAKAKNNSLFRKGAKKIKDMIRGFSR